MRTRKAARALAAVLLSIGMAVIGVVVAPGAASADVCPTHVVGAWSSSISVYDDPQDAGGKSIRARLWRNCFEEDYYSAVFKAYGEHLVITDSYADGRTAKVYLEVQNNGTAVFTSNGDHNLSFDEGLRVRINLCINGTSICTGYNSEYGIT